MLKGDKSIFKFRARGRQPYFRQDWSQELEILQELLSLHLANSLFIFGRSQSCLPQSWVYIISPLWAYNKDYIQSLYSKYKSSERETWFAQLRSGTNPWPNHRWPEGRLIWPITHSTGAGRDLREEAWATRKMDWHDMIMPSPCFLAPNYQPPRNKWIKLTQKEAWRISLKA